ncbi:MAG TPA: hypothetical protein V6D08_02720 [Candidatus Obscuribacterales bacterium]
MDAGLVSYAAALAAPLVLSWQAAAAIRRMVRRSHGASQFERAAPAAGAQHGHRRASKNVQLRKLIAVEESLRAQGTQVTLGVIAPDYVLYGLPPGPGRARRPPRVL